MGKTYDGCDWFAAQTFILGGRNKVSRRWGKTRELRFIGEPDEDGRCDIALRLHQTDIVTYHVVDGTQTIYMGGWNTVTTKRDLNRHSVARVYSLTPKMQKIWDGCSLGVYHRDDPLSAPRVQKCRACHGVGIERHWCNGRHGYRSHWGEQWRMEVWAALPGIVNVRYRKRYEWEQGDPDEPVRLEEVRGRRDRELDACWHGMLEAHTWQETCHRCDGLGTVDFGSAPVPWGFNSHDAITVDASGKVITEEDRVATARLAIIKLRRRMRRRPAQQSRWSLR